MGLAALIFDADGTLADTEETHRQAFNYAFVHFGLAWEWSRPLYRALLTISGGEARIAHFVQTLPTAAAERSRLVQLVPAIHREKTRVYAELIADGRCMLRPGVARLFEEARACGIRLAIASTSAAANVEALLTRQLGARALHAFSCVACAEHVSRRKPAPDLYRLVLAMLGQPADRCAAFEDSANGVRAAKEAGLFTVATPSRWTAGDDFAGADLLLSHLGDEQQALPAAESAMIGSSWLGLAQLRNLHAAALERAAPEGTRP